MKKAILLVLTTLLLSGCSLKQDEENSDAEKIKTCSVYQNGVEIKSYSYIKSFSINGLTNTTIINFDDGSTEFITNGLTICNATLKEE